MISLKYKSLAAASFVCADTTKQNLCDLCGFYVVIELLRGLGAAPRPARAPPRDPAVFPDESYETDPEWDAAW